MAELATRFGAAVVVGLIDETGMAVDLERKKEVARRSRRLLVDEFGLRDEDIWWDALVFPCGTGDENYIGSAKATIEGIRWLKKEMPDCRTILGVSNVSFGLPTAGREVLNSVFLYHCTQAGLDAAIVNTQRLARYAEIPADERKLSEGLLFLDATDVAGSEAAVEAFTEHFRGRKVVMAADARAALPVEERLARAVIEGSKEGLIEALEEALADDRWPEALDIINGPLMTGMAEVGRLFNNNELIVAEVLQSAEVMKASVSHLEQYMEAVEGSRRGKVLLATVKGDVHDIGKNLVDIILSNNGFEVVNLGIKVPSEQLIQAVRDHQPDLIGLSGLLVKSAQQMIATASDLKSVGIDIDLVVGGAALSRRFTHKRIAPEYAGVCTYASDAMAGLDLIERLTTAETRPALLAKLVESQEKDRLAAEASATGPVAASTPVEPLEQVPAPPPPDTDLHTERPDLDEIWSYVNPQMLLGKHLGLRGSIASLRKAGDPKLADLERMLAEVKAESRDRFALAVQWRFFPAEAKGNTLTLFDPETGDPAASWDLPRQTTGEQRCLADYVMADDHVPLLLTTAGSGPRELSLEWKDSGDYLKSHAVASLALETAEAAAEWLHARLRREWGFPDPDDLAMASLLASRYRGRRYSFGYPACPDLGGQQALFAALEPEAVGIELTEGDMMDPEASVSALVFHHPDCKYFAV